MRQYISFIVTLVSISLFAFTCQPTAAQSITSRVNPGLTSDTLTPLPTISAQTEASISPSLRAYAELKNIRFGTYFPWDGFNNPTWQEIAGEEFNLANIFDGFSWSYLEPRQGEFDFSIVDLQVAFALAQNMEICGHTLFWPIEESTYPDWVLKGGFTREQLSTHLQNYISTVMNHYKGQINCWIVVEEPYSPPERSWDLLYTTFGGYDYLDFVYQVARETDPRALLLYNDEYNHTSNGEYTALTAENVKRLYGEGLLDGVGLEMHLDANDPPDKQDVVDTMKSYGVPVHVTEIDVNLAGVPGTQAERLALQADIYGDMLSACFESGKCQSFSVWGFGDKYSWLEWYYADADPTLFDDALQKKPAYSTLLEILKP